MSDYIAKETLRGYLKKLDEQSRQNSNDRRHAQYIKYVTAFLRHFGKEFPLLAGSTVENLKLRYSKDGGDADIVLCSGKLEIPVKDLKFREDMPCFTWVNVNKADISKKMSLIEDKYLPGDILRRVDPELFTILRGIYLLVTSTSSYVPGRETRITTTGVESRVGLAREQYRDLKPKEDILPSRRSNNKKMVLKRDADFKQYLERRRQETPNNGKDMEGIEKLLKFIVNTKIPGNTGEGGGQWQHFSHVVGLALQRRKADALQKSGAETARNEDDEMATTSYDNDLDSDEGNVEDHSRAGIKRKHSVDIEPGRKVKVTYVEKTSKDYVPALLIVGILPCMEEWRRADHLWLTEDAIGEIYRMDVLIVARYAPVNPSRKDFCLSFTLAEKKLAECLSVTQRKIVLVMKAYLKGLFTKRHKEAEIQRELKLKTFHIKTIIYRVCDITDPSFWSEDNVLGGIIKVLQYLETAILQKELLHYFVASNLFAGFEEEDYTPLLDCTREIIADPVGSIKPFFDLDDGLPVEAWLMEEEVLCLEKMSDDGGLSREVDSLEEAVIEFQRGFNEGPRDEHGNAPIQAAISAVTQLFLEEEATRKLREAEEKQQLPPGLGQFLAPLIPGLSNVLGGIIANPEGEDLAATLGQFLGGSPRNRRLEEELKYKATSYFAGKPE